MHFTLKQMTEALSLSVLMGTLAFSLLGPLADQGIARAASNLDAGTKVYEVPEGQIGNMTLSMDEASLGSMRAKHLDVSLSKLVIESGASDGLTLNMEQAEADGLMMKAIRLQTGPIRLDPYSLLNFRRIRFQSPVQAQVSGSVSDQALTAFLRQPKLLRSLEKAVMKQTGGFLRLQVQAPSLQFRSPDRVSLRFMLGVPGLAQTPVETQGRFALVEGKPVFQQMRLKTANTLLPQAFSGLLQQHLNQAIDPKELIRSDDLSLSLQRFQINKGLLRLQGVAELRQLDLAIN